MSAIHFAANTLTTAREITHDGRAYLVSPVVALRAGVLNGVLVEAAEFGKYAQSWNGRPIPLGHPQLNGQYISANSPDVWAQHVPGHFWNVQVDGDALKGEIWIDLSKAEALGERAMGVVSRLRLGQPVEVSTGYFADTEAITGIHNGKSYMGIARNIRPDHLALLPDEVGACSWADGCGTPRVNKEQQMEVEQHPEGSRVNGESAQTLFERFLGWLGQPQTEKPISVQSEESPCMHKQELITALVANSKCKFTKEKLETWQEADLVALTESLADVPQADPPESAQAAETSSEPAASGSPQGAQLAAVLARIVGIEELLKGVTANADQERKQIISAIIANASSTWGDTDLQRLDTETLRKIHATTLPRDYSGNGGYFHRNDPEEEELQMRWPDFIKERVN